MVNGTPEKSGWDGPVQADFLFDIDDLRDELVRFAPGRSGGLKRDLRDKESVTINDEQTEIRITIQPPLGSHAYANIQNEGGNVPPFDLKTAVRDPRTRRTPYKRAMKAFIGGATRFFTKRKGFFLPGFQYVEKAVNSWWDGLARGRKGTFVKWKSGKAGETFGGTSGRLSI